MNKKAKTMHKQNSYERGTVIDGFRFLLFDSKYN